MFINLDNYIQNTKINKCSLIWIIRNNIQKIKTIMKHKDKSFVEI